MRWGDLDLNAGIMRIERTIQRIQVAPEENGGRKTKVVFTSTKTKAGARTIALPSVLIEILRKMPGDACNYLLTGTSMYMEPRSLQYHYKKILKEAGVAYVNFHALRHGFATRYIEEDIDANSLSEILGHSSVRTTLDLYVHATMDLMRRNIEKLASVILNTPLSVAPDLYEHAA